MRGLRVRLAARPVVAAVTAAVALLSGVPARTEPARPVCTDASRACLIRTVELYLDGLTRHSASEIPFAPNVRATEQASVVVTNAARFRSEIDGSTAIIGARNIRLLVDPQTNSVAAFYVLDIAGARGKPAYSVWRGERFRIERGYVVEVEVYNYIEPQPRGLGAPLWPGGSALPGSR